LLLKFSVFFSSLPLSWFGCFFFPFSVFPLLNFLQISISYMLYWASQHCDCLSVTTGIVTKTKYLGLGLILTSTHCSELMKLVGVAAGHYHMCCCWRWLNMCMSVTPLISFSHVLESLGVNLFLLIGVFLDL
jgi:hypothetical protein